MLSRRSFFAALPALAVPAMAEAAPGAGQRTLLVAGQSLAGFWDLDRMKEAFISHRAKMGDRSDWTITVSAAGGSAALHEFVSPSWPDNWWIDIDDNRAGPALVAAIRTIKAMPGKPTDILWVQGQQEGGVFDPARSKLTDEEFKNRFKAATVRISRRLRKLCAADPYSIPFYIQPVGYRADGERYGDRLVREAQLELISEYGRRFNLRLGAIQPKDLPLRDTVHPSPEGNRELARRNAMAIA